MRWKRVSVISGRKGMQHGMLRRRSVGSWSEWSACTASCGGGKSSRSFIASTNPSCGGTACPAPQTMDCNTQACIPNIDCVGAWATTPGVTCSATCGQGTISETYTITQSQSGTGKSCPTSNGATRSVSCTGNTPIDCVVNWSDWGACSASCGDGTQTRSHTVTTQQGCGGATCPASPETRACNIQNCPPPPFPPPPPKIDCVGSWVETPGATCSATCGQGTISETYVITTIASAAGAACSSANGATRSVSCTGNTPIDCAVTWGDWGACSASCGDGTQTRTHTITTQQGCGGASCPTSPDTRVCNIQNCPPPPFPPPPPKNDCVGSWVETPGATCSATCGQGTVSETYVITTSASATGAACPSAQGDTRNVKTCTGPILDVGCGCGECCAVNCTGSYVFGTCSATCGGGTQTKTFVVSSPATCNGTCPSTAPVDVPCNTQSCGRPCVGNFTEYGPCTNAKMCGLGTQEKTYVISDIGSGGSQCPFTDGTVSRQDCYTLPLCPPAPGVPPKNCSGFYTTWSLCSQTCGGGQRSRQYVITSLQEIGGNTCPHDNGYIETERCNDVCCPVNCQGQFSSMGPCNSDCKQTSTFQVTTPMSCNGTLCLFPDGYTMSSTCCGNANKNGQPAIGNGTDGFNININNQNTLINTNTDIDVASRAKGIMEEPSVIAGLIVGTLFLGAIGYAMYVYMHDDYTPKMKARRSKQ